MKSKQLQDMIIRGLENNRESVKYCLTISNAITL